MRRTMIPNYKHQFPFMTVLQPSRFIKRLDAFTTLATRPVLVQVPGTFPERL